MLKLGISTRVVAGLRPPRLFWLCA